ncbi:MAG: DUF1043 family protein [Rhodocyclaceae bacterium]|nr:DUF1043 family protein [Rhodocyclaceae bacterium]
MTEQTWWLVGVAAVFAAAVVGFFIGRGFGGARKRVEELEAEVSRQKDEISDYKREVESHFDKTAGLVASMAGSYRDLFEHLSSGYEKLASGSTQALFRERVTGLLLGGAAASATWSDSEAANRVDAEDAETIDPTKPALSGEDDGPAPAQTTPPDGSAEAPAAEPTEVPSEEATAPSSRDAAQTVLRDESPDEPTEKTFGELYRNDASSPEKESGERP